jgi:hypothetical protein
LYLLCEEVLNVAPSHAILRPGVVVSIGLDKNTKLTAVFSRYVDFCNETGKEQINLQDLEFVHCQLLNPNDTAEASALMKNDKIYVRRVRAAEREAESERKRLQRDADRSYFQQLRHLMPDLGGSKTSDVILDCRGKLVDESGRNQQVLCTTVRANSAVLSKRCKWLGAIIQKAKNDANKRSMMDNNQNTPPETEGKTLEQSASKARRVESDTKTEGEEEEDDGIEVLPYAPNARKGEASGAAEIENDDDDEQQPAYESRRLEESCRSGSPVLSSSQQLSQSGRDLLWVTLPDHSPEAVKLLLEYCYTNRVIPLGQEAFVKACKSKPHKHQGPVPPFQSSSSGSRRWPNNGLPLVSFSVALAGISLAEEGGIHRLSLMCEVAASQLLSSSNIVEALSMCTTQNGLSSNCLPRLRKAAMDIVFRSGSRGVTELGRTPAFRRALEERSALIVPTLLQGTMEAVTSQDKLRGVKRDADTMNLSSFDELDREDTYKRERERRKRRLERWENDPNRQADSVYEEDLEEYFDPLLTGWASETAKRSLKRMSHHLGTTMANRRDIFANRASFSFPAPRRSVSKPISKRRGGNS